MRSGERVIKSHLCWNIKDKSAASINCNDVLICNPVARSRSNFWKSNVDPLTTRSREVALLCASSSTSSSEMPLVVATTCHCPTQNSQNCCRRWETRIPLLQTLGNSVAPGNLLATTLHLHQTCPTFDPLNYCPTRRHLGRTRTGPIEIIELLFSTGSPHRCRQTSVASPTKRHDIRLRCHPPPHRISPVHMPSRPSRFTHPAVNVTTPMHNSSRNCGEIIRPFTIVMRSASRTITQESTPTINHLDNTLDAPGQFVLLSKTRLLSASSNSVRAPLAVSRLVNMVHRGLHRSL